MENENDIKKETGKEMEIEKTNEDINAIKQLFFRDKKMFTTIITDKEGKKINVIKCANRFRKNCCKSKYFVGNKISCRECVYKLYMAPTEKNIEQALKNKERLGTYLFNDNKHCFAAVLEFSCEQQSQSLMHEEIKLVSEQFEKFGLNLSYLKTSETEIQTWLFFKSAVNAASLRKVVFRFLKEIDDLSEQGLIFLKQVYPKCNYINDVAEYGDVVTVPICMQDFDTNNSFLIFDSATNTFSAPNLSEILENIESKKNTTEQIEILVARFKLKVKNCDIILKNGQMNAPRYKKPSNVNNLKTAYTKTSMVTNQSLYQITSVNHSDTTINISQNSTDPPATPKSFTLLMDGASTYEKFINGGITGGEQIINSASKTIKSIEKLCFTVLKDIFNTATINDTKIINFLTGLFPCCEISDFGIGFNLIIELNKSYTNATDLDKIKNIYKDLSTLLFIPYAYDSFGFTYPVGYVLPHNNLAVKQIISSAKSYSIQDLKEIINSLRIEPYYNYYKNIFGNVKIKTASCAYHNEPATTQSHELKDFIGTCWKGCGNKPKTYSLLNLFKYIIDKDIQPKILQNLNVVYKNILSEKETIIFSSHAQVVGDLFRMITETLLSKANIFSYGDFLLQINNKKYRVIDTATKCRSLFQSCFEYIEIKKVGKELNSEAKILPLDKTQAYIESPEIKENYHQIETISNEPVYSSSFTLVKKGYNSAEKIYVLGSDDRISYEKVYLETLLKDFCWKCEADKHNYIGHLIDTQLPNHFIGTRPGVVFNGNQPGIGKSQLAFISYTITENAKADAVNYIEDEVEFEKRIGSNLIKGFRTIIVDNAKTSKRVRVISSPFLEKCMTLPRISTRILGFSKFFEKLNNCLFLYTMNDAQLCRDLITRTIPVNLYYGGNPRKRKFGATKDIDGFITKHRTDIIAELRGMIEIFKQQGMPIRNDVNHRCNIWAETIGGILMCSGYDKFLSNMEESENEMNAELQDLLELALGNPNEFKEPKDWAILAESKQLLPDLMNKRNHGKAIYIGNIFRRYEETSISTGSGTGEGGRFFMLKNRENKTHNGFEWAFMETAAPIIIPDKTDITPVLPAKIEEISPISESQEAKKHSSVVVAGTETHIKHSATETTATTESKTDPDFSEQKNLLKNFIPEIIGKESDSVVAVDKGNSEGLPEEAPVANGGNNYDFE
ncbi:hypothetical protein KA977_08395 [Candidatus Dependentiae bacterium]|nr:hypothetical protein [Candidatus Dependentiae bacterium]